MTTPPPSAPPPYGQPSPGPQPGYPGFAPAAPPAYRGQPPAYAGPGGSLPRKRPRQPVQMWDVVLTIVFLVALIVYTALASFAGLFLVMASDSCGVRDCSTELITTGWLIGTLVPWAVLVGAAIWAIVFMVKRRLAFYIPLLGAVGVTLVLVIAFFVTSAGVPTA
ncbi:DUF6264 family protein [Microbacterium sp. BK668]|uniref:DUF6264 family protein n=1 Tax=Microbacterium sp. BK668 TaxID=2512118 RepID=UPI00105DEC92|nr:DUF6264 family protein [Microbacterium sp. BK668]TDN91868.1 hypothetical protein EV279_1373 [Microbacterium sp. BK668]